MADITDFPENEKEEYPKPCPKCGNRTYLTRSGHHIKWSCINCGYLKFLPQKSENFIMPFGKYKGKSLIEILTVDEEYLCWANLNMDEKISKRIKEVILNQKKESKIRKS